MSAVMEHYWPAEDRPLTVDDLQYLPDDGNRYELVNGILEMTPAPGRPHQLVTTRLTYFLTHYCPEGLDVMSPVGMNLAKDHHRIPDIAVVRWRPLDADADIHETRPPLLAVEVASRSTEKLDRTTKRVEYGAFGIESYWIVTTDPVRPTLTAYKRRGDYYDEIAKVVGESEFRTDEPFPFSVVPALLVADTARWRAALSTPQPR